MLHLRRAVENVTKVQIGSDRMEVGYLKISPLEGDGEEQAKKFQEQAGLSRIFWEKLSIKSAPTDMKEYERMLRYLEEGDVLVVPEFARLSKNIADLLRIVERLNSRGITLESRREKFNSSTDEGKSLIKAMSVFADFDERVLLQRRREGIAKAKADGKYKGGGRLIKRPDNFSEFEELYRSKRMTVVDMAKHFNVSRVTIYKWLREIKHDKIAQRIFERPSENGVTTEENGTF